MLREKIPLTSLTPHSAVVMGPSVAKERESTTAIY